MHLPFIEKQLISRESSQTKLQVYLDSRARQDLIVTETRQGRNMNGELVVGVASRCL